MIAGLGAPQLQCCQRITQMHSYYFITVLFDKRWRCATKVQVQDATYIQVWFDRSRFHKTRHSILRHPQHHASYVRIRKSMKAAKSNVSCSNFKKVRLTEATGEEIVEMVDLRQSWDL
ncbi:hypothetical protein T12_12680 [Trichinella patagoniensis]|uniref:Uncharacterized protein n=1 Tax=Trichinella patagoniensis TaxID=990121 RepID=A0A0V1ABB4_9BILA|nr:hypothetical protein T12_12680 [Trichinella patagoniensis]